ncbi:MAG: thymidine phosphorylase [Bacteriovoracaceae bacterium]|nr:thymidine phosphorylase [Bacteriovoracaceae bacterium]
MNLTNTNQNQSYSPYTIIAKKRDGKSLTKEEIKWFISSLTNGQVEDYQMTALLMAIYLQGMNKEETAALTDAMLYSGEVLTFEEQLVIDKHSTGGVGDKTSFILAPIAAACGVKVPMISGRGLGHTGGTVDKSEAIPGFKTEMDFHDFHKNVETHGICMIGQTKEIAPADKKIYSLRDVTATVESIPLITASIMSKKLAEGANGLVMDVKTGRGAFMKKKSDAVKLAKSLTDTGKRFGKNMMTVITDMSQPLGLTVGNSLEIIECIETLKGKGPKDLTDLSIHLAGGMIHIAGLSKTHAAGMKKAKEVVKNGKALKVFEEMIKRQSGDSKVINNYSILPTATEITEVIAPKNGWVKDLNSLAIGLHCVDLGGGRRTSADRIDFGVGFTLVKKIGDKVKEGDVLIQIHHNKDQAQLVKTIRDKIINEDYKFSSKKLASLKPLIGETKITWSRK